MEPRCDSEEREIDLSGLFRAIAARWWAVLLTMILGASAALGITSKFITPQYRSSAMLYILPRNAEETSMSELQVGTELVADCVEIAKSNMVLDAAVQRLAEEYGKVFSRQEIASMISVSNHTDTRILNITATNENPYIACAAANAVSEETSAQVAAIMQTTPPAVVEAAEIPAAPISPNLKRNILMGAALGLVAALAVLAVRYIRDDSIRTPEDVKKYLGLNVLAVIPMERGRRAKE